MNIEEKLIDSIKYLEDKFTIIKNEFDNLAWEWEERYSSILSEIWYKEGINENDILNIPFPMEEDYLEMKVKDFILETNNFRNFKEIDWYLYFNDYVLVPTYINIEDLKHKYYIAEKLDWVIFNFENKVEISYLSKPYLIWLYNILNDNYDDNYNITPLNYWLYGIKINISLLDKSANILNYINSFKFILASKYWINFHDHNVVENLVTDINNYNEVEEENEINTLNIIKTIEYIPSCDLLEPYIEAKKILNSEVKYLLYYKVLEYISVTALNKDLVNKLFEQLKELEWKTINWNNIKNIIEIVKNNNKTKDSEWMIKILLVLLGLKNDEIINKLPASIYSKVWDNEELNLSILSQYLVRTRNKYIHARPNYTVRENECPNEDIIEFNNFMDGLCINSINWFNSLDEYMKITS